MPLLLDDNNWVAISAAFFMGNRKERQDSPAKTSKNRKESCEYRNFLFRFAQCFGIKVTKYKYYYTIKPNSPLGFL